MLDIGMEKTPIIDLGEYHGNHLWMKREDLIPFSFGGNKARKAVLFFHVIDKGDYDSVITYGSGSSNHCRVVANECYRRGLKCYIVSPLETSSQTFNSRMMELFGANITRVPVNEVSQTMKSLEDRLINNGAKPYTIPGGGHGDIGTEAYVQCYREIKEQEAELKIKFDYIFFASGTGTTQAGLVCGQLIHEDKRGIIGVSIARKNPRGRDVVIQSIRDYMDGRASEEDIQAATVFIDDYTTGYGKDDKRVDDTIETVLKTYGIPLDATYTGKAFMGMTEYIEQNKMEGKNILFIHTGGTPLFFDALNKLKQ